MAFVRVNPTVRETPLVVSVPHTGTGVPPAIAGNFSSPAMARLPFTDWHLDRLYSFAPALGATLIYATYSRFVVDLNRAPEGGALYPGRFETGVVPMTTPNAEEIWHTRPTDLDVRTRVEMFHTPYHQALNAAVAEKVARFGRCLLIDGHSIASAPTKSVPAIEFDVCLGTNDGRTCPDTVLSAVAQVMGGQGWKTAVNAPFKGGYITRHYGTLPGVSTLQIEMRQAIYMEELSPETAPLHPHFLPAAFGLQRAVAAALDAFCANSR